jgi:hypothetical protein
MAYPFRPSQNYVQANHPYYPPNPYYQHLLQDPWFQPSPELVPGPLPPSPPVSEIPGQHPSGNTGWQPPSVRTVQYAPEQPAPQDLFAPPTLAPPAPAQAAPAAPEGVAHDRVIDTIIAEAAQGGFEGMLAVAATMNNRAAATGLSLEAIVSEPEQYAGYANPGEDIDLQSPTLRSQAELALSAAQTGVDPTNGAVNLFAGRTPDWATGYENLGTIGGNVFFGGPAAVADVQRTYGVPVTGTMVAQAAAPQPAPSAGTAPVNVHLQNDTMEGMRPEALAGLQAAQTAAAQVGLTGLNILGAFDEDGGGHLSHYGGTEFDISGVNADGSLWTDEQRVAVATAVAQTGGDRFGFYTGPSRSLHFGYAGLEGGPKAPGVWGPNNQLRGVAIENFAPAEQAFAEALRAGTLGQYAANSPLGIIAAGPQSPPEVVSALQNTLRQTNPNIAVDGIWGPQTEQAFAALQGQPQQPQDIASVLAATEAFSPTAPMVAPQMTAATASPSLVADALPVSPATDRAYAPASSGLPQAAQAIQDASPVLPAMEGAVLDIAPVAPPVAAERPMPQTLNPAADYGIGIPSAPQPQELQPLASYDLDSYDPNVPIEQQIAPQGNPDQRIAQTFEHSFPMQPVEQTAALPANPAPPEAMAAPFGQIMQGPFETAVPGGAPPEATAALPAPAASQLTPDVRVEQGFGFDPQPIADWELVERAFLEGHPDSMLQPDQAPPVDMARPTAAEIGALPAVQPPAEDYTTLSPLQPQTDFGFVPDYQTIATSPPPQVAAPVAPDFATLSLSPDMPIGGPVEPTLAAPVPPSAIDAPYLGGYELPAPGVGSLQFSPEANLSLAPSVPAPSPLTPSVTSVQTTSFAPDSVPFQPGAFTPPTMQFEQPFTPPAPPAPPAIQVIGQDAPTTPTGAVAPDIQTIDPPEATEPPTPLSLDAIASQAGGFGATGLPSVVAARTGPGIGNFLGAGIGAIATTALGAGPIPGAVGGWRAGGWLGNQFGGPPQPQMQPPPQPRPVFNPFNGQFMGYDTSGQDGGDGYGGNTYGSGGFTGSYPGMGHFSGPNPGPNDPNYGYA